MRDMAAKNTLGQDVKHMIYFQWLHDRIKEYPALMEDVKDILEEVEKMSLAERQRECELQLIHGDFWTGK